MALYFGCKPEGMAHAVVYICLLIINKIEVCFQIECHIGEHKRNSSKKGIVLDLKSMIVQTNLNFTLFYVTVFSKAKRRSTVTININAYKCKKSKLHQNFDEI